MSTKKYTYTPRTHFSMVLTREYPDLELSPQERTALLNRCVEIYNSVKTERGNSPPFRDIILIALSH